MKVYINELANSIKIMDFDKEGLQQFTDTLIHVLYGVGEIDVANGLSFNLSLEVPGLKDNGVEQISLTKTGELDMYSLEIMLKAKMERLPIEDIPDDDILF